MSNSLPINYQPDPAPYGLEDLPRYIEQELNKIAQAIESSQVAVAFTIAETSTINVTTTPNWQRLFQVDPPSWEVPGGTWSQLLAQWTCPTNGLYNFLVDLRIQPYGSGNKVYYAGIRLHVVHANGDPTTVLEAQDSGDDAFVLGVTLPFQGPLFQGDIVFAEATVVHDQFAGTTTAEASMQINRLSV